MKEKEINLAPGFEKNPDKEDRREDQKEQSIESPQEGYEKTESGDIEKQKELLDSMSSEKEGSEPGGGTASFYASQKTHRKKEVENTLSDGLDETYLSMSPEKQKEFREKGEEVAEEINKEIENPKFNLKKVVNLIRKWLSIIPGVNKFFLEQESKIKADKINKIRKNL